MKMRSFISSAALMLFAVGCDSDNTGDPYRIESTVITATETGSIPQTAELAIIWDWSGDQTEVTAGGRLSGNRYEVTLPDSPPSQGLLNDVYGIAVGYIFALDEGQVPEFRLYSDDVDLPDMLGLVYQNAIIYKSPDFDPEPELQALIDSAEQSWFPDLFPYGYSCARNIARTTNQGFDSFEPADCLNMELRFGTLGADLFLVGGDWD